jgi:hypothetical protein
MHRFKRIGALYSFVSVNSVPSVAPSFAVSESQLGKSYNIHTAIRGLSPDRLEAETWNIEVRWKT